MGESTVRIGLVLPDVMGTYGDGGNAVILRRRLAMRGYDAEIVEITLDMPVPESLDIYTLGGAEDYAQRLATRHLLTYPGLQKAAANGAPVLAICAAIQVLGHWYETSAGEKVEGISLFDVTTSPQEKRSIGEISIEPIVEGLTEPLVGFENHRGGTTLGPDARGLGRVLHGTGNGVGDGLEGVVQGSVYGTYMHGPALARNPQLADLLIMRAIGADSLEPLNLPEVEQLRRERLAAAAKG
ncbi:type 1 glutamine amidotransferase [Smaragdicoccus niigatensis]|uniref:type 1 glutamine amidotransferase n=1 Tax=Smaragdicoccus niigatensis TaxID=359359 RepID=UPI00037386A0|nr:glutamine amidotransferase [Smaragdicoccus niigatensis]